MGCTQPGLRWLMQVHHPVHVTSIPMEFSDVKRMAYLCSCDEMKHARLSAVGADSRLSSFSGTRKLLCCAVTSTGQISTYCDAHRLGMLNSQGSATIMKASMHGNMWLRCEANLISPCVLCRLEWCSAALHACPGYSAHPGS